MKVSRSSCPRPRHLHPRQSRRLLFVDREGRAFLENQEIPIENLFERLKKMIGRHEDKLLVIKADRSVILNKAVRVMDVAKAAGAGRLCLATEKDF